MEAASDTGKLRYSLTSTPILDGLRPLPRRKWLRLTASEYFFLSGAAVIALTGLPLLRRVTASLAHLGVVPSALIACFIVPAAALLLSQAAHELGHMVAGRFCGFSKVPSSSVIKTYNYWSCDVLRVAGSSLELANENRVSRRLFVLYAAGPAANFLIPAAVEAFAAIASWGVLETFFVHAFTGVSVLQGIADLLPDITRGNFSDGSRILMLLRKDAVAQRWLSVMEMHSSLLRGQPPSVWDEARVASVTAMGDDSRDAVLARWLGYLWAMERQDITTATRYLEDALAVPAVSAGKLRGQLFFEAAIFQAWFRDDSERARFWASQIKTSLIEPLQRPRLAIALMWSDGKLFEAWEKMRDYLLELQQMPGSPARDLAEKQAREWKAQIESRMLTRAWRTMYSMSQQIDDSAPQPATSKA